MIDSDGNPIDNIELHSPLGLEQNTIDGYPTGSYIRESDGNDGYIETPIEQIYSVNLSGNNYSEGNNTSFSNPNNYNTHPIPWLIWDITTDPDKPRLYGWPQEIDENRIYNVKLIAQHLDASRESQKVEILELSLIHI